MNDAEQKYNPLKTQVGGGVRGDGKAAVRVEIVRTVRAREFGKCMLALGLGFLVCVKELK